MQATKCILAIETSCDETAVSIIEFKFDQNIPIAVNVLAHKIESQIEIHKPFGGVVPEIAARDHLLKVGFVAEAAMAQANLKPQNLHAIAVTMGPGLIGALMVGVLYARGIAIACNIPLLAINHVDAHLAPLLFLPKFNPATDINTWFSIPKINYPALALTVSGGHCHLSYLTSLSDKRILGSSIDDACGEAFDKVAKLLGMPYPGGPQIEALARTVEKSNFVFPSVLSNSIPKYHFSYSGIKTSVLTAVRKLGGMHNGKVTGAQLSVEVKAELAFAFQEAALGQLANRVKTALNDFPACKTILVAGGVAANKRFHSIFSELAINYGVELSFAPLALCSDNATMIGLQSLLTNNSGHTVQPFTRYFEDKTHVTQS